MKDDTKKDGGYIEMLGEYRDTMLMDGLLRITALENILMRKNIITAEEIKNEITELSTAIAKSVSERFISKMEDSDMSDIEKWAGDFKAATKKTDRNSN